ncbi:MAG: helix-turn-helix domain-containing protein [Thermoplasma acidophilum]|nr:helix-turn-helix domain-containing protein [Thermoplasma acidophilum]
MYYLTFNIASECGLAEAAASVQSRLLILNVVTDNFTENSLVAISQSNDVVRLKEHLLKDFKTLNIIQQKKYNIIMGKKISHGIMAAIEKNGGIPVFPLQASHGTESFQVIVLEKDNVDLILDAVSRYNNIETFDYTRIGTSVPDIAAITASRSADLIFDLTETERNVLSAAYSMGYFSWPRNVDLLELSRHFGMAKPTVLYHIRNAQKKIMKTIFWH